MSSKIIKPNVSILEQEPGIIGMKKHIEQVARLSYRSENRITDVSYEKFVNMLYTHGHWAAFNLGTVYMIIPEEDVDYCDSGFFKYLTDFNDKRMSWNRVNHFEGSYYITTNYRVICQLDVLMDGYMATELMEKYWSEPTEHHYHRITTKWTCSRSIAQQVLRHRVFSPIMESTRYVNFSLEKFHSIFSFTLPQWVYDVREKLYTEDSTAYSYLMELDGQELWDALIKCSELVRRRNTIYTLMEQEYLYETSDECDFKLKPEDVRDVLGMGFSTNFFLCGYVEDYCYTPEEDSTEKAGLFFLRTAPDAQRDIRVLATDLQEQFKERGLDLLL